MEATAAIFSVMAALFFSTKGILIKKSVVKVNPLKVTFITIVIGLLLLLPFSLINGDFSYIYRLNQTVILYLALAGVLHFIIGRTLQSYSIKLIGASRSQILTSTDMIYAPIFAVLFIGELVRLSIVAGIVLIVLGTYLILLSTSHPETHGHSIEQKKYSFGGTIFGLAGGAFWGITPILVKVGVSDLGSPILSNIISYIFASLCYPMLLFGGGQHKGFGNIDKSSWFYMLAGGASVCIAQIFRYTALLIAPVSFVVPISSLSPAITIFLSYMFIREIEMINLRAITGILLALLGICVMSYL